MAYERTGETFSSPKRLAFFQSLSGRFKGHGIYSCFLQSRTARWARYDRSPVVEGGRKLFFGGGGIRVGLVLLWEMAKTQEGELWSPDAIRCFSEASAKR